MTSGCSPEIPAFDKKEAESRKFRKRPLYMVSSEWARIQLTGITKSQGALRARLVSDLYMVPPDSSDAETEKTLQCQKRSLSSLETSHTLSEVLEKPHSVKQSKSLFQKIGCNLFQKSQSKQMHKFPTEKTFSSARIHCTPHVSHLPGAIPLPHSTLARNKPPFLSPAT